MLLHPSTTTNTNPSTWTTGADAASWTAQARRLRLTTDTAERRRGLRVAQARPVKVLDAIAGRTLVGSTVDVSTTGLRVELATAAGLRVGDVLGIHVGLSRIGERLANRRQMIPARVVWVRPATSAGGGVVAGFEFAAGIGAQRDAA